MEFSQQNQRKHANNHHIFLILICALLYGIAEDVEEIRQDAGKNKRKQKIHISYDARNNNSSVSLLH